MSDVVQGKGRGGRKPIYDPASGEPMDDEWQPLSWNKTKQAAAAATQQQLKKPEGQPDLHSPAATQLDSCAIDGRLTAGLPAARAKTASDHIVASLEDKGAAVARLNNLQLYSQNKLSSLLFKHKEQLKKEIARKRNLLEKELSQDIGREVDSLKQQAALKLGAEAAVAFSRKRRSQDPSTASAAVVAPTSPAKSNISNQVSSILLSYYLQICRYLCIPVLIVTKKCQKLISI